MKQTKREQHINIRAAGPLREALEAEAARCGTTLSELVRTILIDWAARRVAARHDGAGPVTQVLVDPALEVGAECAATGKSAAVVAAGILEDWANRTRSTTEQRQ